MVIDTIQSKKQEKIHLICRACRSVIPLEGALHLACPNKNDQQNHILEKRVLASVFSLTREEIDRRHSTLTNPYLIHQEFFYSWALARKFGVEFDKIVRQIDKNLRDFGSTTFIETPLRSHPDLAREIGLDGEIFIKDETTQVGGSHKARFLMGTLLYLEVLRKAGFLKEKPKLAIYSCGNAAMGASVVARAAGYDLDVFVPPSVNPRIHDTLNQNQSKVNICNRKPGEKGDPCYLRFREALECGKVAFSCSGPDNWSNIEGGQSLFLESFFQMQRDQKKTDHLVIQVGGGALASSCVQTWMELKDFGFVEILPKIHTVQTRSCYPLARIYAMVLAAISEKASLECHFDPTRDGDLNKRVWNYFQEYPKEILLLADFISKNYQSPMVTDVIARTICEMPSWMWAWEEEPHSVAHGILDDITYDWLKILEGMLASGGRIVIVDEDDLNAANKLAREKTKILADHTGTAGLAGVMKLILREAILPSESVLCFFTGVIR